jgi:hypothetical protein
MQIDIEVKLRSSRVETRDTRPIGAQVSRRYRLQREHKENKVSAPIYPYIQAKGNLKPEIGVFIFG